MPTKPVPNLIQGISLQQPEQRRYSQCEWQVNCVNSPIEGCVSRPPTEFVAFKSGLNLTDAFFHEVIRGDEHYLAYIKGGAAGGDIGALDLADGTTCTVTVSSGSAYLNSGVVDRTDWSAQAVDDYSFLACIRTLPAFNGTVSPTPLPKALIVVKQGDYSRNYDIRIRDSGSFDEELTAITAFNVDTSSALLIRTTHIALALQKALEGAEAAAEAALGTGSAVTTSFTAGQITVTRSGNLLLVNFLDNRDFTIDVSDGGGDQLLQCFKDTGKSITDLPARSFDGFSLKIKGADRSADDDYYVEYDGNGSNGSWEEIVGPALNTTLNPATMPHVLVNTGYRTFEFRQQSWSTRIAGDDDTAPAPSFVGKGIRDLFYHEGRLGILHESGAVWGKTNFPFTWFPDTVQTHLATAPIDYKMPAASNGKGPATLDMAVATSENMFFWAQQDQRRVLNDSTEGFKEETISVKPSSAFSYVPDVRPVPIGGDGLYWLSEASGFVTLRTATYRGGVYQGSASLSEHVEGLIPPGARILAASEDLRTAVVTTTAAPGQLYLYNWRLEGQEYVQSAWNVWTVPGGPILWANFKDSYLYLAQQHSDGLIISRVDLRPNVKDPVTGATYRTRVDLRVSEAQCSVTPGATTSTVVLPFPVDPALASGILLVVREDKPAGETRGYRFEVTDATDDTLTVAGDLTGYKFYVGYRIPSWRWEGKFLPKDQNGVVEPVENVVVASFSLRYAATGYTRVELRAPDAVTAMDTSEFQGHTADFLGTTGTSALSRGTLDIPINLPPDEFNVFLINDSFYPSAWQSAQWTYEGNTYAGRHASI